MAAQNLFRDGVTVRNQTVLLNGVNNDITTMQTLIRRLAELNIQPVRQTFLIYSFAKTESETYRLTASSIMYTKGI